MVMQWTVNPPPSGTPGSIPGYSTNYSSVVKWYNVGLISLYHKFDSCSRNQFLYPVSLLVRTLAFQVGKTGSIPVQDASFKVTLQS